METLPQAAARLRVALGRVRNLQNFFFIAVVVSAMIHGEVYGWGNNADHSVKAILCDAIILVSCAFFFYAGYRQSKLMAALRPIARILGEDEIGGPS